MNTIGEHLDHAERQLRHIVDSLESESVLDSSHSAAYLLETRNTVHALHDLLLATWGPATRSLKPIAGTKPDAARDTLVELIKALDRPGNLPTPGRDHRHRAREADVLIAARRHVQAVGAIIQAHVGTDREYRSPDAVRLNDAGGRWALTERIAALSEATATIEAKAHELRQTPIDSRTGRSRAPELLSAARGVLATPHRTDAAVLALHEGGHRSLQRDALWEVAEPLERVSQQLFRRDVAGDLDGVSVRTIATTGLLVTGHLEVIARAAQQRAPELWSGPLGQIREVQLRRVAAEALTARQEWQQVLREMRPLTPVGRPDVELMEEATKVRGALEAVTRRDDQWRSARDLVRSRREAADLLQAIARVSPDIETLASRLDAGLSRAQSADLSIRADKLPGIDTYVADRLRRRWIPVPNEVRETIRTAARRAEAASRTMAVSAAESSLSLSHEPDEAAHGPVARAVTEATRQDRPVRSAGALIARQL